MRAPAPGGHPRVRLALRYDPCPRPGREAVADGYDALLAHVIAAESRGVDLVWISERPLVPGAAQPAALPLGAAISVRTTRVRIGIGPLALASYHPLRVAEDAATLDGLSGGRLELALGLGDAGPAVAGFGVSRRSRGDRLEEGVALVRAAWTGAPLEFAGRHHSVSGVTVSPRPTQAPGPPLWVGAGAEAAVRRAARLGTGLLATDPGAIELFLQARCALPEPRPPARVGLEQDAGVALAGADHLAKLLAAAGEADVFDLVIAAEPAGGSGWLGARDLDALLALRATLASLAGD